MSKSIYTKEHKKIIEKLKKARLEADLSQAEVSRKMKKSQSYISKIENGQLRLDLVQLKELAEVYKKQITYFI